ncbi:MAG: Primosomal protein N' [Parcubacteria group bacterium ADurb.Bin305]|nr:hypothetical protein [Candidatus Paceibacterota bacterium]OQA44088.1 MAG: Primosomal protein N' [Parcubacteria group bacterium ADurb.Bin305]
MPNLPIFKIIDLNAIPQTKEYQPLSQEVYSTISEYLEQNKKIIIFINKKGLARSIVCQDCGYIFNCSLCDIPLVFHKENNQSLLRCHHCGSTHEAPTICPQCQGHKLKLLGIGTERVLEDIKKHFPSSLVALIEGPMEDDKEKQIMQQFQEGHLNILIGTTALLRPQIETTDLTIVPTVDTFLSLPDYQSEEKIFFNLWQLKNITQDKMIIQTMIPKHKIFNFLQDQLVFPFLQEENSWRQQLLWPPYVQLIKLTYSHKNITQAQKATEQLKKLLALQIKQKIPTSLQDNFIISGPAPAFIFKEKNKYHYHLFIKFRYFESSPPLLPADFNLPLTTLAPLPTQNELNQRNKILQIIPPSWKIEVDPKNIL